MSQPFEPVGYDILPPIDKLGNQPTPIVPPPTPPIQQNQPLSEAAILEYLHHSCTDPVAGDIITLIESYQDLNKRLYDALASFDPPTWIKEQCRADPQGKGAELLHSLTQQREAVSPTNESFDFPNVRGNIIPPQPRRRVA